MFGRHAVGCDVTANDIYTVAGSSTGTSGYSGDSAAATAALLDGPSAWRLDSGRGHLYRRLGQQPRPGSGRGDRHPVGHVHDRQRHLHRGRQLAGASGYSGDSGAATSALLDNPRGGARPSGELYIADTNNNGVREVAVSTANQWGLSMTAGDIYTIAGGQGPADCGDGGWLPRLPQ